MKTKNKGVVLMDELTLFTMALGLSEPWEVVDIKFSKDEGRLTGHSAALLYHALLSQLFLLSDHTHREADKDQTGQKHRDQEEKNLFAVTPAFHFKKIVPK
jgi:hypothetical protein